MEAAAEGRKANAVRVTIGGGHAAQELSPIDELQKIIKCTPRFAFVTSMLDLLFMCPAPHIPRP